VTPFHALSDSTRIAILRAGELCVCELKDELEAAQSRLSFHLRVLRDAGLVEDRREGRWSYYRIVPDALADVHDLVVGLQPARGALPIARKGACCG
jgi:ArsR family transcriptional regulator, arsenate/arsenite/antimonite-responsive transcriptional repressor